MQSSSDGAAKATWPEPVLEDVIEKLEWAYQNRDALNPMAQRGAETMAKLTWRETASRFFELLGRRADGGRVPSR